MAFITVAGENQIAAKQGAGQTLNITSFVLAYIAGLGSEPANRIEAMPAAGNIKATLPVTQSGYVNTNQVVYSLVMDSSLGDYDFNWVGLVDDAGVLIAVTYTPTIQKRKTAGAVPGNNLTRNFLIAFSGIQATTAIAVPAETWQIDFNARLWGIDERERLSNYDIYGHEGFFGDGWKVTRQGATTTYDVAAGIGYVGGVRIASAVTQQVTVSGPPKSIWLDVSLQGDISDVSAVVSFAIDAILHNDYTDANGFKHYVTKIADIAANGSVTDTRVNAEFIDTPPLGDNDKSPVNSEWVQQTIGKVLTKSVAGNSNVTLTAVEAGHGILVFTGALTANIAVIVPTSPTRSWIVKNGTSGAFTLTVKTAAGTGVVCSQGKKALVYTDGTNVEDALTDFDSPVLTGTPIAPTPAQFDATTKLSTAEFVQRALGNFSNYARITTAATLSAADTGNVINVENGSTITLPLSAAFRNGCSFLLRAHEQDFTLQRQASDSLIFGALPGASQSSVLVKAGESILVINNNDTLWHVFGGSILSRVNGFSANIANNGHQKLPSGLIIQWGGGTSSGTSSGNGSVTFSAAFPTACLAAYGVISSTGSAASLTVQSGALSVSGNAFSVLSGSSYINGQSFRYFAIGY
ncbi:MAG: phage tail-collar fiber domain-containing protein [Methylomicrobium sp.]